MSYRPDEPGWIYVVSNPCMPGLVKIGLTTVSVDDRVKCLSAETSVPAPFEIEGKFYVDNVGLAETEIHSILSTFRVSKRKEFFQLDASSAVRFIRKYVEGESVGLNFNEYNMVLLDSSVTLGRMIKRRRIQFEMTQQELSEMCGVGVRFLSELERGKPTAQVGLVLHVLSCLGIRVGIDNISDDCKGI